MNIIVNGKAVELEEKKLVICTQLHASCLN